MGIPHLIYCVFFDFIEHESSLHREAMGYVRAAHVIVDRASRKEKPTKEEQQRLTEALEWFAYWYFEDQPPTSRTRRGHYP